MFFEGALRPYLNWLPEGYQRSRFTLRASHFSTHLLALYVRLGCTCQKRVTEHAGTVAQTGSVWCLTAGLTAAGMKHLPAVDAFTKPNKNTDTSWKFLLLAAGVYFLSCLLWVPFDCSSMVLRADIFDLQSENRQRLLYLIKCFFTQHFVPGHESHCSLEGTFAWSTLISFSSPHLPLSSWTGRCLGRWVINGFSSALYKKYSLWNNLSGKTAD